MLSYLGTAAVTHLVAVSTVSKRTAVVILTTPHEMMSRLGILPVVQVLESTDEIPGATWLLRLALGALGLRHPASKEGGGELRKIQSQLCIQHMCTLCAHTQTCAPHTGTGK